MVESLTKPYTRADFITESKIFSGNNYNKRQLKRFQDIKKSVEENYENFLKTRKPITNKKKSNFYKNKYDKGYKNRNYNKSSNHKSTHFKVENWRSYKENKPKRDEKSIEVIRKLINLELNKLSADNFNKIESKILSIIDKQDDLLNIVIEDLFKKAVQQKTFCKYYAELAYNLNNNPDFKSKLQPVLLNYCKKLYYENEKLVVVDKTTDYDTFCEYLKYKKRFIGNFQFMGELYKKSLLDIKVIEDFWNFLLLDIEKEGDLIESYSECICQLLQTIGLKLEEQSRSSEDFWERWMKPVKVFSENREMFKPRMRFLFMDCLERKKWH